MTKRVKRIIASLLCAAIMPSSAVLASESEQQAVNVDLGTVETDIPSPRYDPEKGVDVFAGYHANYEKQYDSYNYELFIDILKLYTESHLYEFTEQEVTEAFLMKLMRENPSLMKLYIDTLLGTMDEYSAYYEAGMGLASDGSGLGYGLVISDETNYVIRDMGLTKKGVYITEVTPGSNAEAAGIASGDRIVSVEGIPVESLTYDAATVLIKALPYVEEEVFDENGVSLGIPNEPEFVITDEATGKKSYYLHMTLERGGTEYEVKLVKSRIIPSNIGITVPKEKNYAYISIASFIGDTVVEDFKKALQTAKSKGRENLIIDLRDNGGGALENAILMANLLIAEKGRTLFYLNSRDQETLTAVESLGGGETFDKITVMVNGNTASASELLAMILSYQCGAIIVGSNTYGKAVGQNSFAFTSGDIFTITTFEILDPLKKSYNRTGLVPDVETEPSLRKHEFPTDLEVFNYINYKELSEGSSGDTVMGLERRLALMGILREQYVDGIYDEATTAAVKALRADAYKSPDPLLDDDDVENITNIINRYKNYYYLYDAELEVAEMTFSSRSQAKRRAKELARESELVEKEKAAWEAAFLEQIKREDEEEMKRLEAEAAAQEENAEEVSAEEASTEEVSAEAESPEETSTEAQ